MKEYRIQYVPFCEGIQDRPYSMFPFVKEYIIQNVPFCEGIQYTELRLPL